MESHTIRLTNTHLLGQNKVLRYPRRLLSFLPSSPPPSFMRDCADKSLKSYSGWFGTNANCLKGLFIEKVCGCVCCDPRFWPCRPRHHGEKLSITLHTYDRFLFYSMSLHLYCRSCITLLCRALIAQPAPTPHDNNHKHHLCSLEFKCRT